MEQSRMERRLIGVYVDPEIKEWVREKAEEKKWSLSFFCHELLREAMERSLHDGAQ